MNWPAIYAAAKRAEAAYIADEDEAKAAFAALGLTFIGQHRDASHQAVLSHDAAGATYLSISGTRFGEADNVDLLDDLYLLPVSVPRGGIVAAGAYSGMQELWQWVSSHIGPDVAVNVEGHSLGGERTLLTPLFLPKERIGTLHAFDAPKCASQAYWDVYREELAGAVRTVNRQDLWYGWPPAGPYQHDEQAEVIWLVQDGFRIINAMAWPGGFDVENHAIAEIVTALEGIASAGLVQA
ncbi:hypothetical protein [Trinickia fusca]|uniref:Uncharacterized protein n=1 Tax=Trinickia fusca TaxID=2419777 RepID=A0A494XP14_9BURK|nr:hypothetical protein [Trinickia fusca]RKP50496.1 hypothetical protein D7S89_05165 [Trinickia fusca]